MSNLLGARHQKVARLRKLLRNGRYRASEGVCALEGITLLAEALRSGVEVESVFLEGSDAALEGLPLAGQRVYRLAPGTIDRVATTQTPQPVLSIARWRPVLTLESDPRVEGFEGAAGVQGIESVNRAGGIEDVGGATQPTLVMATADVREPGNLGTIIRSAVAAGAGCVAVLGSSVDVTNPKVLRASAGTVFAVPVVQTSDTNGFLAGLQAKGVRVLGLSLSATSLYTEDLTQPVALVLGNEAHGLDAATAEACDAVVSIPQAGPAESLNVAMAGTVAIFEAARQRTGSSCKPLG